MTGCNHGYVEFKVDPYFTDIGYLVGIPVRDGIAANGVDAAINAMKNLQTSETYFVILRGLSVIFIYKIQ